MNVVFCSSLVVAVTPAEPCCLRSLKRLSSFAATRVPIEGVSEMATAGLAEEVPQRAQAPKITPLLHASCRHGVRQPCEEAQPPPPTAYPPRPPPPPPPRSLQHHLADAGVGISQGFRVSSPPNQLESFIWQPLPWHGFCWRAADGAAPPPPPATSAPSPGAALGQAEARVV